MLKIILMSGLLLGAVSFSPALAQDASAPPAPAAAAPAPAPAAPASAKSVVAGCQSDAIGQGLKGAARKTAVDSCIAQQRPDIAAKRACSAKGKAQGVARGTAMRTFIKGCLAQGGAN